MRSRTLSGSAATSKPATVAVPPSGSSSVVRIRTAVVLPAPLGPSNPRIVPRGTAKSSPSSAVTFPNRFTSPDVRIISVMRLLSSSVVFLLGQASQQISSPAISRPLAGGAISSRFSTIFECRKFRGWMGCFQHYRRNLPLLTHVEESMIRTNLTAEQARTEPTIVPGSGRVVPLWVLLALVCLGQFMVVLDISIVNVALPSIQAELRFTASGLQWVVNAYTLTFAGFLLLGGRAADLFGRRRMFLVGLAMFTAASFVGGLAQTQSMLIAARALQGLGGAVLAPATLTILTTTFAEGPARTRALGVWSAVAAGGGAAV